MTGKVLIRPGAYVFAAASVFGCSLVRWLLNPLLESQGLYLAFMIPVACSAYMGGVGPGVVSAALSAAIASPFVLQFPTADKRASLTHVLLFVVESAAVILLIRRLQSSRQAAQQTLATAEAARHLAEELGTAKEQFVARVSHEWRAPLNSISGWLSQLERRATDPEFVARATASMRRAVETQSRLVSDLLDYSRGSQGKLSIECDRLQIGQPVARALEATSVDVATKQLTINVDDRHADARVLGDAVRLEQVFTNLLQNATKFTPNGGTVSIAFARVDDQIEVTVTDTGVGISSEDLETIFKPFVQTSEDRDIKQGGLGLGLSIAREIVQLHGGSLTASSGGPGMGTSFALRLPLATEHHRSQGAVLIGNARE